MGGRVACPRHCWCACWRHCGCDCWTCDRNGVCRVGTRPGPRGRRSDRPGHCRLRCARAPRCEVKRCPSGHSAHEHPRRPRYFDARYHWRNPVLAGARRHLCRARRRPGGERRHVHRLCKRRGCHGAGHESRCGDPRSARTITRASRRQPGPEACRARRQPTGGY
jgi:hypothetical protein